MADENEKCKYCGSVLYSTYTRKGELVLECVRPQCQKKIEKKRQKERLARMRSDVERHLKGFKVPSRFLTYSLDGFIGGERIVKWCREYAKGLAMGCGGDVLFTSDVGTGKTHLATAILREAICQGFAGPALFVTAPELLLDLRESFDKKDVFERDIVDKYADTRFLILDDLGTEKTSEWAIQSLYIIIDRRNRELRPTVFTTNLSLKQIGRVISRQIESRLCEAKVIETGAYDRRRFRVDR